MKPLFQQISLSVTGNLPLMQHFPGLYLFIVLIVTFVSESRVMLALYSIGWGLPAILVVCYAVARASFSEEDIGDDILTR